MMWDELQFAFALTVSGLSIGLMYSLIALGFVLVYKATEASTSPRASSSCCQVSSSPG
jgi:hypothetical protein